MEKAQVKNRNINVEDKIKSLEIQVSEVHLEKSEAESEAKEYKRQVDLLTAELETLKRNPTTSEVTESGKEENPLANELESAKEQIAKLNEENKVAKDHVVKLEQLLAQKLPAPSNSSSNEARLQEEIRTLINEHLEMRERMETLERTIQAYRDSGAKLPETTDSSEKGEISKAAKDETPLAMIKVAERDVPRLVTDLILQLDPEIVSEEIPGIAMHIIFMSILFADRTKNASLLQNLLTKSIGAIKEVVTRNTTDMNMLAFWMANTFRLLNNMKQFSGEKQFKGISQSAVLENFDLQQYRNVLSDLLLQIHYTVVKHVDHQLSKLTIPAMLEHESIPGMANQGVLSPKPRPAISMHTMLEFLSGVSRLMTKQCVDPELTKQIFAQAFYGINARTVNTLLLRKDFCHWSKGMQVRYNLTKLEEWARDNGFEAIKIYLIESIQISQLLQVNKSSTDDIGLIEKTCSQLNSLQIQKILTMYSPTDSEDRVPASVIRAIVEKTGDDVQASQLMMDETAMFPVKFPYEPCAPDFSKLELPSHLCLNYLDIC
eukprot:m.112324 g.112324  ORF g.112324 m.112324 type:complete len:547 (+) comp14087_c0_seq1:3714-5354(+)